MSKQTRFPKTDILGVEVDILTKEQAVWHIIGLAQSGATGRGVYVVKPYVEFLVLGRNPKVRTLLNEAYMTLPESIALVWAAHYQQLARRNLATLLLSLAQIVLAPSKVRSVIPETFAGVNFTRPLLEAAAEHGVSVFLIGSPKHNTIDHTAAWLQEHIPKLKLAGTAPGYLDEAATNDLVKELRTKRPGLTLIGIGFPKQERLARRLAQEVGSGVYVGEGGSFDYSQLGGGIRRAPAWVQKLGLEWLWRLVREPKRLKRQFAIPRFIWRVYTKE